MPVIKPPMERRLMVTPDTTQVDSGAALLSGVEETLLIPLWARAVETRRPDGLVRDPQAVRILQDLAFDDSRMTGAWKTQAGIAIRTWLIDRLVAAYLAEVPNGTVVTLGAGLDARSQRLDNGRARWIDLDLPDAMAVRDRYLPPPSDRHIRLSGSVLEADWLSAVPTTPPPLLLAEGLVMYLPEDALRALWSRLADHFPGGRLLVETISHVMVNKPNRHDVLPRFAAPFRFGTPRPTHLDHWDARVTMQNRWSYFDMHRRRWRWLAPFCVLPVLRHMSLLSLYRIKESASGQGRTVHRTIAP